MIYRIYIIVLFTSLVVFSRASTITIEGMSVRHKGSTLTLETYEDYFTKKSKVLAETTINNDGTFSFMLDVNSTFEAFLKIKNVVGIIYLSPNTSKYKVYFPDEDYSKNPLKQNFVNLIFEDLPKNDINILILEYNLRLDKFLYNDEYENEFSFINDTSFTDRLDTFKLNTTKIYQSINDAYFYNYVRYSIAGLQLVADGGQSIKQKYLVFNEHINTEFILYHHDMYMEFFNEFYESELKASNKEKRYKIHNALVLGQYSVAMEALDMQYTKRDDIKELVLMKTIAEAYPNEEYDKTKLKIILDSLYRFTTFEEHQTIAKNYFESLTKMEVGTTAPTLTFITSKGETKSLSDFKGGYVYINFTSTQCTKCLSETNAIQNLKEKYGKSVEFISIFVDDSFEDFAYYANSHNELSWNLVFYNNNFSMLEAYNVKTLPVYYLIDGDGKVVQSPAYKPIPVGDIPSISETLYKLTKNNTPRQEQRIGEK